MNRIYRLVWCRSRKVLVVASELAFSKHGNCSSSASSVDRRLLGSTSKLLLVALIGTGGVLFASGASAQSVDDTKLSDLQSLIAKYDTSHTSTAPTQVVVSSRIAASNSSVSNTAPVATALPTAVKHAAVVQSRIALVATREAHNVAATHALADISSTVASRTPVVLAKASIASQQQLQSASVPPSASPNSSQSSAFQAADTADRKLTQVAGAQLAQQESTTKTQDSSSDVQATDVAAQIPAIKRPEQPVASTLPTTGTSTPVPKAAIAANVVADATLKSSLSGPITSTSEVADRRLKHPTDANDVGQTASTAAFDDTDTSEVAAANPSPTGVSPLAFTPLSSVATSTSLSSFDAPVSQLGPVTAAVPVFPTPSSLPTGLVVGNGGLVGAASQLLGTTTNSLFSSGNGYVSNGSLQVINSNYSQAYSVVSVLGIPLLTLNPVGTLLTSTTGTLVGGTGENSHLTLLGGVTSNSYIYNINNGNPSGVLGLLLPNQAPAFASSCLNALVVQVACYGINAAQDYQVLVGDGATANGSKEVVIGTNASHTLPLVNANTAFPGAGVNSATDPSGVPTADYEARLGHSVVIGDSASGTANAQTILGAEATSDVANSVALGYQSIANRGALANYMAYGLTAVQNSAGEVSIGSPGQERQITNVAAGSALTDAVNVAQLEGVVAADTSDSVQYDNATHTSITLAGVTSTDGGLTNGTTLTNLHQGNLSATSTDAVNGAQLFATNNTVSNIYDTTSKYFQANSTGAGSVAAGTDSIAAGPQSVATGNASVAVGSGSATGDVNAVAIGTGANASFANSVALGAGSVTTVGALTNYAAYGLTAPQTSLGEVNVGDRQITGIAAGSAGTDAVNVNQLASVGDQVSTLNKLAVQYDADVSGNPTNTVTLSGNGSGAPVTVTNVAPGALNATSADAVNGSQLNATNNTVSNIYDTTSKYFQANSTGIGSSAVGTDAIAAGPLSVATGNASIALGSGAAAGSDNSVAIGTGANASFVNSVAIGNGSVTSVGALTNYTAYALSAPQTSAGEVSIGSPGAERQLTNVAAGSAATDAVNVEQLQGVAADAANSVQYDDVTKSSVTLAGPVSADGGVTGGTTLTNLHQGNLSATSTDAVNGAQLFATNSLINNIYGSSSKYFQVNSIGTGSDAVGTDAIAAGPTSVATGASSIAVGSGTQSSGDNSIALGTGANASFANSVAIGNGSLTTVGALTNYTAYGLSTPQNSVGEVSIGSPGAERQLTNVAAGSAATDAVNVEQLQGVTSVAANSVQYDNATKTSVTLAGVVSTDGGLTNGTTLTNLHQGMVSSTSTDAVNGAQLWNWTLNPGNQYSNTSLYNDINNSAGSKYYAVDSTLAASQATGTNAIAAGPTALASGSDALAVGNNSVASTDSSIAIGSGANASFANSIALGAGSATVVGALANYTAYGLSAPQTSAGELNVGNRQITGVAAGSAPDDAVNLAQLEAVSTTGGGMSNLAVLYDADASGNPTNTITLTGNGSGAPVGVTNVAAGAETATSTDAVNGSQLWNWTQNASNMYSNYSLYNDINSLTQGSGANSKYVQVNSTLGGATAGGTNSVAIGPVASASGTNSVAVGNGASAAADNSVALGAGSLANRDNTVSVGTAGGERQITNVAAGTSDTDAANVGQLNTGVQQAENWANSYTDQRVGALSNEIQQVGNRANAGVAAAMAMAGLPQAYEPGKSMAAVAAGTFRSESSLAIGVSTISEGGRWVYKMTGSVDTRGDGGVSVGAGMQW